MARTARTVGERIEQLLGGLAQGRQKDTAEELVRLLVEMYGDALTRVVALLRERDPALVMALTGDELLESLLLLHDLHPVDVDTRIQRALDRVRPYLGSHAGGVEYLGVDGRGVAQLRLEGSCNGCPSSTVTVRSAIEGAILDAAPELAGVEVAGVAEPERVQLLQIGMGPPGGPDPRRQDAGSEWTTLPDIGPPAGRPVGVTLDGVQILVCAVRGSLYAYRDECPGCGSSLAGSTLEGEALACSSCRSRFDVRLAGRGLDGTSGHLDPLPLLADSRGVRVAVPRTMVS
jgi:Fe-S cluster biogenesis protein NfuA/nitrite reductase/ring-hydroxylating ferredoxin subunit